MLLVVESMMPSRLCPDVNASARLHVAYLNARN